MMQVDASDVCEMMLMRGQHDEVVGMCISEYEVCAVCDVWL